MRANMLPGSCGRIRRTPGLCFACRNARHRTEKGRHASALSQRQSALDLVAQESTIASVTPFAAIFNNLVVFDPAKVHESLDTVIPDLAESWSWDPTNTKLTFKLRQGVKWHDGQPFTAKDVQCTWRMLIGKGERRILA